MSDSSDKLALYSVETGSKSADVTSSGLDVFFPDFVRGWSDVLDCRPEPYNEKTIEENIDFAEHVHKKFILVAE